MRYLTAALALLLAACSDKKEEVSEKKNHPPPEIIDTGLAEFTGGRTKVVWTQYQNPDKADKQGTSRRHLLMGLDTADGRGERQILPEQGYFAYPIITPDGKQIVFTRKVKVTKGDKRKFDTTIEIVNFDGSGLRTLGDGYAQEVWEEPETGRYWIYAGHEFVLAGGTAPICKRIIRFPIDDPSKREVVWERTQMGTDSFAISGDGKRFAGLFPWPAAGIGNLEDNTWKKVGNGCWVAMAPDNSYDMWVFDGPHRNFTMYDGSGNKFATFPVNTHPDIKGREMYHPRWGNHRQFFVLSGPHVSGKKAKRSGKPIEIYMGKFSPELDHVESWFKVSNNSMPDGYPDMWVEGGSNAMLAKRAPVTPTVDPETTNWPSDPEGLLFMWENTEAQNEFTAPDGSNQISEVAPKEFAHYGRNYEMLLDGGSFEAISESDALLRKAADKSDAFGFQVLVTPNSNGGVVFESAPGTFSLENALLYSDGRNSHIAREQLPIGTPTHIAVSISKGKATFFLNGKPVKTDSSPNLWSAFPNPPLTFGSGLNGSLEHIAFYSRPLTPEEVATDAAIVAGKLAERKPVERLQLRGKLTAMSQMPDVDAIKPYVRALVYYLYETDHPDHKEVAVGHWAILDKQMVPGFPREIGKTYDLVIEPQSAHPQLDSQAVSLDDEKFPFHLKQYYDVSPPAPKQ